MYPHIPARSRACAYSPHTPCLLVMPECGFIPKRTKKKVKSRTHHQFVNSLHTTEHSHARCQQLITPPNDDRDTFSTDARKLRVRVYERVFDEWVLPREDEACVCCVCLGMFGTAVSVTLDGTRAFCRSASREAAARRLLLVSTARPTAALSGLGQCVATAPV